MASRFQQHYISGNFVKLWSGQFFAVTGTQFGALAFPLVAISVLDASAAQLGILAGLAGLPWLLFGLFVGVAVDRYPRRPIIVAADFGRGILVGWIAIAALTGFLTIEQLYVATFLIGVLTVLFETAYQSFLPSVVEREQLVDASGKLAATESVATVAGPSIAGFVIQVTAASFGLLVDAVSYFVSSIFIQSIKSTESAPVKGTKHDPILRSLWDGFGALWNLKIVRWFALSNATFMLFFTISQAVIFVFYTRDVGLEAGEIGLIFTVGNIGAILGATIANRIGKRIGPGPSILIGSVLRASGVAIVPIVFLDPDIGRYILIVAQFVQAVGWSIWAVHQGSTRQMLIPDSVRGRVNGSFLFLVRGITSVGGFAGALIVDLTSVRGTLVIAAVGVLVGSLWLIPANLMAMKSIPDEPTGD